jgi:hypothetical protein
MDIKDIPSIGKVKRAIRKLSSTKFPKFENGTIVDSYVESVIKIIVNEFGIILNPKQAMKNDKFLKNFFRVRPLSDFKNIDLIREHSYPPIDIVKMGRCNFPNHPVFYCSTNPGTALLEVARDKNDSNAKYCISSWELIQSDQKVIFESFLQIPLPPNNLFIQIKQNTANKINEPFLKSFNKKLKKEQKDGLLEYLKYLDSSFINDIDYSISATLAHRTLFAKHDLKTDILMYPSVQSLNNGVNLAIRPNFVDNNLRLNHLYILSVDSYDLTEGKMNVTLFNYGEVLNNDIMWKNINPEDKRYHDLLIHDFGEGLYSEFKTNNLS